MRVLVTGGAGFIGSHLVDALVARGDDVVVLDDLSTGFRREHQPERADARRGVRRRRGRRPDACVEGCEVVFHQAAHKAVLRSVERPLTTDTANTHGTLSILKAAADAGVRRVVHASSSSVYGGAAIVPTPESAPLVPRSPYAVTKLAAEHYCRVFAELYGLETVALRYFNVYGPRQRPDATYAAVIPLFVDALLHGREPEVHGDGLQSRDFTYIDDVVAANLAAASAPAEACSGHAYNVAPGVSASLARHPAGPRRATRRHARTSFHRPQGRRRAPKPCRCVSRRARPRRALHDRSRRGPRTDRRLAAHAQLRRPSTRSLPRARRKSPRARRKSRRAFAPQSREANPRLREICESLTVAPQHLLQRLDNRTAKVVVVGQGYVGLPIAVRAAAVGFPVVGFDTASVRIDALGRGESYVEDVSADDLARALASGYQPTLDRQAMSGFDVAIITVPTPLREGVPDLSFIEAAGRDLAPHLRAGALVVLESTTYPGTTEELLRPILEESGLEAGTDFFLGYSPERIDPGNPEWNLVNTPKVVSGLDAESCTVGEAFYGTLVDKVVRVSTLAEAELVKLLENTFRHVNIALVNELTMFSRDLGVDIWSAIDAAATKPYGFMRFTPGPGVGGHCLPIDPSYLAWRVERRLGHRFRFVELANDVNRGMPEYVVRRAQTMLNDRGKAVRGARVLLLGLAYKPGTSDWRESPAMVVAERLFDLGAEIRAHDADVPDGVALGPAIPRVACTTEELEAADLVVLLTDHPELPYDEIAARSSLVLDTRGRMREMKFCGESL